MTRQAMVALAALALTAGCGERARVIDGLQGRGLAALPRPETAPSVRVGGDAAPAPDAAQQAGLYWSFEPSALQVLRSTAVHLRVDAFPDGRAGAGCRWRFGDGTPATEGCEISHTFHGGHADQPVTLTVTDGPWSLTSTRVIPLERLPVTPLPGSTAAERQAGAGEIPAPPKAGPTSFRLAFVADTAGAEGEVIQARVAALTARVAPQLVVHVGGVVGAGGGDAAWDRARDFVDRPLRGAKTPVAWAMSPTDLSEGARVRRPTLALLDGSAYPERYTFSFKGVFFMVVASDPEDGLTDDDIAWMRASLAEAQIYASRIVVSHLPLHQLTEGGGAGVLRQKFRVYELLLRARVTALVSAGQGVYFTGRYGALPVVSVGPLGAAGRRLSGHDFPQPRSFAVMDLVDGVPARVFAVAGPGFDRTLDEAYLPESVEVYVR